MKSLTRHVDAIVAPIVAREARKNRFREELLAHLLHAVEARRAEHGESDATCIALEQLGPPELLRDQLAASVPRWERVLFLPIPNTRRLENWLDDALGELSPLVHATRMAALGGAMMLALHVFVCLPVALIRDTLRPDVISFAFIVSAFACCFLFVFTYGLRKMRRSLTGEHDATRSRLRAMGWALAAGAGVALSAIGLWPLAFPDSSQLMVIAGPPPLSALLATAVFTSCTLLVCGHADAAKQRRQASWGTLARDD